MLFRKKKPVEDLSSQPPTTVICIPGVWISWSEFIVSIVNVTEGEYFAAGNILMNAKKEKHFTIDFCERDEKMKEAFRYAGSVTRVSESFLDEVESHKYVIYISCETGNFQKVEDIAWAAEAVLKAGGIGVKIETAGKAFEKAAWYSLLENIGRNLYAMFVVDSIVDKNGSVYSCGMHNLGYKDTIISGEEFQNTVKLIRTFSFYQIVDKPQIINGQTFSVAAGSPIYRITVEVNQPNSGHDLFENPFGMWRLTSER